MNLRQHTILARRLIKAVGGPKIAEHVGRVNKTQLYMAQDFDKPYCLPADVIVALEAEAGTRLYSAAMRRAAPAPEGCSDLLGEAIGLGASASSLAQDIHVALEDGILTPNERERIMIQLQPLAETIAAIRVEVSGPSKPNSPAIDDAKIVKIGEGTS